MLVIRCGPVTNQVISGDFQHNEARKSNVGHDKLGDSSNVAQVFFVDTKVDSRFFIVLICRDLASNLLGIFAYVSKLY